MNHSIMITVDGYSWVAVATTHHTGKAREVSAISCADVPLQAMAALDEHVVSIHDVLEVVRTYLNDSAAALYETKCGSIEISWRPLDADQLREDLTGLTFHVKIVDRDGKQHAFNTGASSSLQAWNTCSALVPEPHWSTVVRPLGY